MKLVARLAFVVGVGVISTIPCEARSYKANGGSCDMVAIKNTTDQYGEHPRKKGEISMMVFKTRLPDSTVMVAEYRCCDFNIKDWKYVDDCRLPFFK